MPSTTRTVSVIYRPQRGIDAIDQYSHQLVAALDGLGVDARYALRTKALSEAHVSWILLQYQPFRYGRWGFAPALIRTSAALRRKYGARIALMVHEAWVPMLDWRSTMMGLWQRGQLHALARQADCVMASTEALARDIGGAIHVPVPANIVPVESSPASARARLGLVGKLIITLFGRAHETRALDHAEEAIAAVALAHGPDRVVILNLGADAPPPEVPPGVDVRSPGAMTADELSLHLWTSDIVLLPFTDGISTRRSTLMAALAHGRPVVGLFGCSTDSVLASANDALVLTPVGDRPEFARAVVTLAVDPARRQAIGEAGQRLYEQHFDWPVIARTIASLLGIPVRNPGVTPNAAAV